jgi:hypothetical protein
MAKLRNGKIELRNGEMAKRPNGEMELRNGGIAEWRDSIAK